MIEPVIPLRALEHYNYCARQAAIIHVDGVWRDNAHTIRGRRGHRRVDNEPSRVERGKTVIRGLTLWSERLGLTGRADVVEVDAAGNVTPVEYKSGTRHGRAADIQLCAQAICLEEMLSVEIPRGFLWFAANRRRVTVPLDRKLRDLTVTTIIELRQLFDDELLPPAVDDERCNECQLRGYCLPDLVADTERVANYVATEVFSCK